MECSIGRSVECLTGLLVECSKWRATIPRDRRVTHGAAMLCKRAFRKASDMGHNYLRHNYLRHNHIGHNHIGHNHANMRSERRWTLRATERWSLDLRPASPPTYVEA